MTDKRIILSLLALLFISSTQAVAEGLVIKGKVEGIKSGKIHLVVHTSETKVDTLATAPFKSSKFTLKADVAEPIVAQLVIDQYAGGFTFIAEPGAKYEALLKNGEGAYIKGGTLHNEWQAFATRNAEQAAEQKAMKARFDELRRKNKFRSASALNDSIKQFNAAMQNETETFLSAHDDIITAHTYQMHALHNEVPLAASRALYNKMGENAKRSTSGRIMKERIDRMAKTVKGRPAPQFTLPDLQGNDVKLSEVKAKVKILDFWASWCGPCRLNNPHLKGLYEKYHDKGLEVIGISLDNKKELWAKAVEKDGLPWIHVSSLSGFNCPVVRDYNVTGVPAIFVLNEKDEIIGTNLRGEALDNFLADLFE